MRSPWVYRVGAILLFFVAGIAIWMDAKLSMEWIEKTTNANKIVPHGAMALAFVNSVLCSSFGAIATNPLSWRILFVQSKKLAAIGDGQERLLNMIGYGMLGFFIFVRFIFIYGLDLISTHAATKNWFMAAGIVFSSDFALMLAVPQWMMNKAASVAIADFDSRIGYAASSRSRKTVDTSGYRE